MAVPRKEDSLLDEGDSEGGRKREFRETVVATSCPGATEWSLGGSLELPLIWLPFLWEVGETEKKRGKNPEPRFG